METIRRLIRTLIDNACVMIEDVWFCWVWVTYVNDLIRPSLVFF